MPEASPTDTAAPPAAPDAAPASAAPAATPPIRPAAPAPAELVAAPAVAESPPAAAKPGEAGDALSKTTDITAGPGGVMTREVGVITGDLTLRSEFSAGKVTLRVQYKDADEWYVVTGGRATLNDPADLEAVHKIAVGLLNRPEG